MGGHLFGSWFWRLGHWYGRVKSTSRKSQLIPGASDNQRGQTQSMLSNVVSGEQLHSGSFCAGWDGEGISRMGAYSDHTGELPKRGREASGLSRGHRGNLGQHSSDGATETDFSVNTRPGSQKTLLTPGFLM